VHLVITHLVLIVSNVQPEQQHVQVQVDKHMIVVLMVIQKLDLEQLHVQNVQQQELKNVLHQQLHLLNVLKVII